MTNIYETTIIVKPDLANDQLKNLNSSIDQFFSENNVSIGYREDWGIKNLKSTINKYSKLATINELVKYLKNDKKNDDDKINFILLRSIGKTTQPNKFKISVKELKHHCESIAQF